MNNCKWYRMLIGGVWTKQVPDFFGNNDWVNFRLDQSANYLYRVEDYRNQNFFNRFFINECSKNQDRSIDSMSIDEISDMRSYFEKSLKKNKLEMTAILNTCSAFKLPQCQVERFVAELR